MSAIAEHQNAMKINTTVLADGRVEFNVPLPQGAKITVLIFPDDTTLEKDLLKAAESSLDFWDNPLDDEDWNNA